MDGWTAILKHLHYTFRAKTQKSTIQKYRKLCKKMNSEIFIFYIT